MPFFFFAGILLAVADWIATARDARGIRWVTKPGALLSLLLWFTTSTPSSTPPQVIWFTLALCFSLIGDIFIHMEGYQLVKGGLAFILAHIAFIISYNIPLLIPPASLLIFATNIVLTLVLFRRIIEAIRSMGDTDLAIGVGFYALALTTMTSTAISVLLRPTWPPIAAWPTALGAMFFYTSDVLLFQKHFLERKPVVKVLAIITYHIGQFALTYGFLWFLYS